MTQDLDDAALWLSERLAELGTEWPGVQDSVLMRLAELEYKLVVVRRQITDLGETPKA